MTEPDTAVLAYETPAVATIQQPWWIGSLLCVFVVATSHFGLKELFGNAAYVTTFGFLALGIFLGVRGIWKSQRQLWPSVAAICLNILCVGVAIWLLRKG